MSRHKNGKNGSTTHRRPTVELVTKALDEAARDAVNVHKQSGLPMVDWQDGKVVLVSAEEVEMAQNAKKTRRRKS
jgi:hypothetical protein